MSDGMLLNILRMPSELAMQNEISRHQYWQRARQAADEIESLTRERDEARAEVERLRADAADIATIAHSGGLTGLSEAEALVAIRRLTLRAWADRNRGTLLAEVERLLWERPVAEVERLQAEKGSNDWLRAEIERLRAENELHEARVVIIRQAGEIADLREDNERLRAERATSSVEIKEEEDGR